MWSGDFPRLLRNLALCHRCGVVFALLILHQHTLVSAQHDYVYVNQACESLKQITDRCFDGSSDPDYVKHLLYAGAANCISNDESAMVVGTCMPEFLLLSAREALNPVFGFGWESLLDNLEPSFRLASCDGISNMLLPEPQSQTLGTSPSMAPSPSGLGLSLQSATQVVVASASQLLGALMPAGELLNLSDLAFVDASLNWLDVLRPLRRKLIDSMSDGPAVLPLDGATLMLVYRWDVLDAMGEQVPRTWNELTAFVESYSESRPSWAPDAAMCATTGPSCDGTTLFEAVWHSIAQSKGVKQGVYFNSQTLQPTVSSPAFLSAYRLWERLWRKATPQPAGRCGFTHPGLRFGHCALVVGTFEQVKEVALSSRAEVLNNSEPSSNVGRIPVPPSAFRVTQLPGSSYILDPETESYLVNCTAETCPLGETTAEQQRRRLLSTSSINRTPYVPNSILMGGISARFSQSEQLLAWHVLSYLASPTVSLKLVTALGSNLGPFRASHFTASAAWAAQGYDPVLIQEGLDELLAALQHSNLAWGLHMPDGAYYMSAISALLGRLLPSASATPPSPQVLAAEISGLQTDLATYYSRPHALEAYKDFIQASSVSQPPPLAGGRGTARVAGIAVAVTVAGLALLGIAAHLTYRSHCGWSRRRLQKQWSSSVPAVSPSTTLLITDIEDSTKLWEELPEVVMGRALHIHHSCLRHVLVRYQGYESATEGDSFILAFHRPDSALAFAVEAQQELLEQDWPTELLLKEVCAPVYTSAPSGFPLKRPATLEAVLSRMSLRQPASTQPMPLVLPPCLSQSVLAPVHVHPAGHPQELSADMAYVALHGRCSRPSAGRSDMTSTAVPAGIVLDATTATSAVAPSRTDTTAVTTSPVPASPDSRLSRPSVPSTPARGAIVPLIEGQALNEGQPQSLTPSASSRQLLLVEAPSSPVTLPPPVLKPGGLSRKMQVLREQQCQQSSQLQPPVRSPSALQHMHLQYNASRSMLGSSLTSSSGWAIIHGGVACSALQDEEMSGATTHTAACGTTAPAGVTEFLSSPSTAHPTAGGGGGEPAMAVSGCSARAGCAVGSQVPMYAAEGAEVVGSSEPLNVLYSSTRPSRSNHNRHTRGGGGGTPPGTTLPFSGHGPRSTAKPLEGPYSSGGMSVWEASTLENSMKATSKQYEEGNTGDRKRRLLWRGLRVRMGLHSGIASASELTHNRASARTVYSGECASVIRAVADSAQGGLVVLTEACHTALVAQQLAAGSTHTAASEALMLHIGRYRIRHRNMTLSLYLATCNNLAPRAATLPPPRNITPVGLTTYTAPVGRAAVAVLNVPDLPALREWDGAVTLDAVSLMTGVLLEQLAEHRGYLVLQDWQHGTVMAAFAFPLDAVRWALHCRQQFATTTEWPPSLLTHELCREGVMTRYPLQGGEQLSGRDVMGSTLPSVAGSGALPSPASGRRTRRTSLDLSHALSMSCDHAQLWTSALSGMFGGAAVPLDAGKGTVDGSVLDEERDTCASSLHYCRAHRTSSMSADLDAVVLPRPQQAAASTGSVQLPVGSGPAPRVPGAAVVREGSGLSSRWGHRQGLQVAQSQGARVTAGLPLGPPPAVIYPARSLPAPEVGGTQWPGTGPTAGRASSYIGGKIAALSTRIRSSGINTAGGYLESTVVTPRPTSSTISAMSELQHAVSRETVAAARGSSSATQGQEQGTGENPNQAVGAGDGGCEEMSSSRTSPVPRHGMSMKGPLGWPNSDDAETEDGGDMFAVHLGNMDGCGSVPRVRAPSISSRGLLGGGSHLVTATLAGAGEEAERRSPVQLRGPRIRVGIDCGAVEWSISSSRHCLTYSGPPVSSAVKLASAAASGHVLATTAVIAQVYGMQIACMARGEQGEEGTAANEADGTEGADGFCTGSCPRGLAVVSTPVPPASTRGGLGSNRNRRQQLFSCRFTANWEEAICEHEAFLAQANGSWHTATGVGSGGGGWNSPRTARLSPFLNAWNWSTNSRLGAKRNSTAAPATAVTDSRRTTFIRQNLEMFRSGVASIPRLGKETSFQFQPTPGVASSAPFVPAGGLLPAYLSHAALHTAPSPARAALYDDLTAGRITLPHSSTSRLMSSSSTFQTSQIRLAGAANGMPVSAAGARFRTIRHPPPTVSASAPTNVILPLGPRTSVLAAHPAAAAPRSPVLYPIGDLPSDSSGLQPRPECSMPEDSFSLSLRYHASKATATSSCAVLRSGSNALGQANRLHAVGSTAGEQPFAECSALVLQLEGRLSARCSAPATAFSSGLVGTLTLATPAVRSQVSPFVAEGYTSSVAGTDSVPAMTPLPTTAAGPVVGAISNGRVGGVHHDGSADRGSVSGMLQQALRQHRSHAKRLEQHASQQQRLEHQGGEQQQLQHPGAGDLQAVDVPLQALCNEFDLGTSTSSSAHDSTKSLVSGVTDSLKQSVQLADPMVPLVGGVGPGDRGGPAQGARTDHLQGTGDKGCMAKAVSAASSVQEIRKDAVPADVRAMEVGWPAAISLAAHRGYGSGHSFTSYKGGTHLATVAEDSGALVFSRAPAICGCAGSVLLERHDHMSEQSRWSTLGTGLHALIACGSAPRDEHGKNDCFSQTTSDSMGSPGYFHRQASTSPPREINGRQHCLLRNLQAVGLESAAAKDEFGGEFDYPSRRSVAIQPGGGTDGGVARVQSLLLPGDRVAIRGNRPLPSFSGLMAIAASPPGGALRLQIASSARSSASRDLSLSLSPRASAAQGSPAPEGTYYGSVGESASLANSGLSDELDDSRATVRPPAGWRPGVHPPPLAAPSQAVSSMPQGHRSSVRGVVMVARGLRRVSSSAARSDGTAGLGIGAGSGSGRANTGRGGLARQGSSVYTLSLGRPQSICHNLDEPDMWLDESYVELVGEQTDRGQY